MPRTARIVLANGIYHVFNRGINREPIFRDDKDYIRFLTSIRKLWEVNKYDFILYSYVLMPNHFHFLMQTRKTPLAK